MEMVNDLGELYEQHFARLVRSLGVAFDPESAADAVQEAFLVADRRWKRVASYADPIGWIRRVALNRLLNEQRNTRRRAEILSAIRPTERDATAEALVDLRSAIEKLPVQMRLSICLHYLGELSVAEVAAALDIAEGTVKSHLHDGRHRLRTLLEDEHHG